MTTKEGPMIVDRRLALRSMLAGALGTPFGPALAAEPIKVGILHSLSGTMAISESILKDVMLMLIGEQNRKGGLLGRPIEAVVVDPASDWPRFAEQARQLLERDRVAAVFGCWTSVSRKTVLPVFEALDGLLFYPVQYEGQESSRNVFYTGATPNQQAIPALEYLKSDLGIERWVLVGTDYVYPRTTNLILQSWLGAQGVQPTDMRVVYTPFGHADWSPIVRDIKAFGSSGRRTAVISTVNGDANVPFYAELARQQVSADEIPVMAFSIGEKELTRIDPGPLVGHLAAWSYFMSVKSPLNGEFVSRWHQFIGNTGEVTNDPMEAHYLGFNMWIKAVEKARTTDPSAVRKAIIGARIPNLSGGDAEMLPSHNITKPALIGKIQKSGQFRVVWKSKGLVAGDAWSDYVPESRHLVADWTDPVQCGRFDSSSRRCLDAQR
jgi:urea transport system substrate-binding protein